jgi:hypothetical protein
VQEQGQAQRQAGGQRFHAGCYAAGAGLDAAPSIEVLAQHPGRVHAVGPAFDQQVLVIIRGPSQQVRPGCVAQATAFQ